MKTRFLLGAVLSLPLLLSMPLTASAQQLPNPAGNITVGANCTLVQAINYANATQGADMGTCTGKVNGSPVSTITIPAGNPITLNTDVANGNGSVLPFITSSIVINGNGNALSIPKGAGSLSFFYLLDNNANLTLNNLVLSGATNSAIQCSNGQLTINGSQFSSNSGNMGGALKAINPACSVTVNNSTFSNNSAQSVGTTGGAIAVQEGASLTATSSTFVGNSACNGGAISATGNGEGLRLTNVTISGNTAITANGCGNGGGLFTRISGANKTSLRNTIVSGNTAPAGNEIYVTANTIVPTLGATNLFGHSGETNAQAFSGITGGGTTDITATSDGSKPTGLTAIFRDLVNGVPQLSYNGGATDTLALARATGTKNTGYSNPAVDAADKNTAPTTDQRGSARAVGIGGVNDGSQLPDIGAYELVNSNFGGGTPVQFEASNPVANTSINNAGYTAPAGMSFTSVGVLGFQVNNLAKVGDSAIVRIVLPTGTNPTGYVKCDAKTKVCAADPAFAALTAADLKDPTKTQGYFINGDVITLKLTDGVTPGDSDGNADQVITDPGAPVVGGAAAAGGGGGAFGALLLLPLGAMAFYRRRRHQPLR